MARYNQPDLFAEPEPDLFADAPRVTYRPDPDDVRRLTNLLHKARSAETMPWSERDARLWQTVFPNMANWLPEDEAEPLRFAFAREMERLSRAA